MIGYLVQKRYFRNENHAIWFLCSVGFFIIALLMYFRPSHVFFLGVALVVHLPALINSTVTVLSKKQSELYSKDCIWFNFLMIVVYTSLYLFT